jgi:hypothetical protein
MPAMSSKLAKIILTLGFSIAWIIECKATEDFVVGAYLPEHRDYIQVNQSAPFLTDLHLFSAAPGEKMGEKQLNNCCLNDHHYNIARQAKAYKAEQGLGDLRLWLTVGGAGRSEHFLHDTNGLIKAIRNVVKEQHLDGVSIDCESFWHDDDYLKYQKWIRQAADILKKDGVSVAITLHVGQYLLKDAYADVDQVHLMAYDMHGSYHADTMAVEAAVGSLIKSGCPANKIIVGIPAYARHSRRPGDVMTFAEIIDDMERTQSHDNNFEDARYWKGFQGESALTVKAKVDWARKSKLGGIFFWELGQDKQHAAAPGGILLEAAAAAVKETIPSVSDEL